MIYFSMGYLMIKPAKIDSIGEIKLSIIVPFRNEDKNLNKLLNCLSNQSLERESFEVVFINDHSTDSSTEIILKHPINNILNVSLIHLDSKVGKKNAILKGIENTKFNWIVSIDADIIVNVNWLENIAKFINKNKPDLMILPVKIEQGESFFKRIQQVEFILLSGITAAAVALEKPFLCNGANLVFSKETFNEVNPFDDNLDIASGDDLFLLQKIKQKKTNKIIWMQDQSVIATTPPKSNVSNFLSQRIRWAGKANAIKSNLNTITAGLVFLISTISIVLFLITIINNSLISFTLTFFMIKSAIDIFLYLIVSRFYGATKLWYFVFFFQPLYCLYAFCIGLMSIFITPKWKGRKIYNE